MANMGMANMRTWIITGTSLVLLIGLVLGTVVTLPSAGAQQPSTPTPTATEVAPQYRPPAELPEGPISEDELRQQLIAQKEGLCGELELIAGIIVSTGTLREVPTAISEMTGLPIDELEAKETRACQRLPGEPADEQQTTTELLNEVRTVEWLVRMHLAAVDRELMQNPRYRPIDAEGSFRAFFEMHNISVQEMRDRLLALSEEPTLEEARALAAFWQDALIPHAQAEDRTLWPLARSLGDPNLTRSADLLEQEHRTIDDGIARYTQTLRAVEGGQAQLADLVPIAEDVRIRTELHFGKEEESLVRPLQQRLTSEQFRPVVDEIDQAFGPWLRQHGWTWGTTAR